MNSSITPGKGKDTAHHTNEERQSTRREHALVHEMGENLVRRAMIGHVCQRDQNGKEAQDVQDQNKALEARQ